MDSVVRSTAIDMIQYLGSLRLPEMATLLRPAPPAADTNTSGGDPSIPSSSSSSASSGSLVMQAIVQRLRDPDYGDKQKLNDLMKWIFS
jgi:hypothetical protein